jgi:serine O-acetyltransferase
MTGISATVPDMTRESKHWYVWNPSRSLLASIRAYQLHSSSDIQLAIAWRKIAVIRHRFWTIMTGADVPLNCKLGGGLLMPHPNGIVIHPDAVVGPNCLIFQQVTIGIRDGGVPCIGGQVNIGAGAKLLGRLSIGDHATIGANAVVLNDVPQGATAVGVPAKLI